MKNENPTSKGKYIQQTKLEYNLVAAGAQLEGVECGHKNTRGTFML